MSEKEPGVPVTFKVPQQMKRQMRIAAATNDTTIGKWLRDLVKAALETQEKSE